MCTSFFVYMVFAMVILRIKEDFDISMETVSPTEQKLIDFRTRVYLLSDLLGMLTLVSFLISCLSFCYLLEEETLEDYFLAIAWCIVIWSGTIILYTLRRTRLEKERE
uniref:Uncharacterized protein n=1 Tax=Brassica oleracea TaxID=3712 RepID=A0A3P6DNM4_BRAOL|nr:unnamed protein product [Brassica oleracea]